MANVSTSQTVEDILDKAGLADGDFCQSSPAARMAEPCQHQSPNIWPYGLQMGAPIRLEYWRLAFRRRSLLVAIKDQGIRRPLASLDKTSERMGCETISKFHESNKIRIVAIKFHPFAAHRKPGVLGQP